MTVSLRAHRPSGHVAAARLRADVAGAALTMLAVLGALVSGMALRSAAGLSAQVPVLAVVLTLTLRRVPPPPDVRAALLTFAEVPVVALAAAGAGQLLFHVEWLGQACLVLGLSVGILARRYGPRVRLAGRFVSLPFLVVLVTPVPVVADARTSSVLWAPLVAVIALAWAVLAGVAASALLPAPVTPEPPARRSGSRRRLDAPTRMALQMAVGLTVALVAGRLLFGHEWAWTLLSAFIVASGNRGRGDVVHKAGLRVAGAAIGTLGATGLATQLPAHHRSLLVVLFVVMFVALALRGRSYAFWAAGVTAMVALLHAYYPSPEPASTALGHRLLGVLIGSAVGVAAAWFVTPVRTRDVARRRLADALAALTDDLAEDVSSAEDVSAVADGATFGAALRRLDELGPALRLHRRSGRMPGRRAGERHVWDAVAALHSLEPLPTDPRDRRRLRGATVRVRRAMVGKDDPSADDLPPALATVLEVVRRPM